MALDALARVQHAACACFRLEWQLALCPFSPHAMQHSRVVLGLKVTSGARGSCTIFFFLGRGRRRACRQCA